MILSGDAGATKTELALYEQNLKDLKLITSEKFLSREFSSPEEMIRKFLAGKNEFIDSACIGIPGPVDNGKVRSTNLPWELDEKELSGKLNITMFKLANDLECLATSVNFITEDNLIKISNGILKSKDTQNKLLVLSIRSPRPRSVRHLPRSRRRVSVSSSMIRVPVMSDGIRSGVN